MDAANPVVWQSLKKEFGEPVDERTVREKKAYAMKYNLHIEDQILLFPFPLLLKVV